MIIVIQSEEHEKNSKGIYYSNGNYEAFARPEKPEGVDKKHAYIVGSGLASLAATNAFSLLCRQMPTSYRYLLKPWTLPEAPVTEFLILAWRLRYAWRT